MKEPSTTPTAPDARTKSVAQLDIVASRIRSTRQRLRHLSRAKSQQALIARCRTQLETDERLLAALKSVRR